MKNKVSQWLHKGLDSITTKIVGIIVLAILPLNILVIASTNRSIDAVQQQTILSLDHVAHLYMQQLDHRVFSMNYYFYNLEETDPDFIRISRQAGDDAYRMAKTNLAQKLNVNIETAANADAYFYIAQSIDDFLLAMPSGRFSMDSAAMRTLRSEVSAWIRATPLTQQARWGVVTIGQGQWLLQSYSREQFSYGALLSLDEVCRNVRAAASMEQLNVRIDDTKETAPDASLLQATAKSEKLNLYLHISVPKSEVLKSLPFIQWFSIVLAFAYLLVLPVLIGILNRILLRPLNKIRNALLTLKKGDRTYRISAHQYAEEFRSINQSFNEMADNIENLKIENYEKELDRQKMELRSLQLHIRPHFLLNTFNLLYSLAQIQEYQSIQTLTLYLSDYFRYIFRSGKDLEPFEKEYHLICRYLDISAIRYPNAYEVQYDIAPAALDVEVPPLLIHTFVENIINHALKIGQTIQIRLCARYENGFAEFVIADNGTGMSEEDVARINDGRFAPGEGGRVHVGIANSYQRLRYFYGAESTLRVASDPQSGTRFTLRFPYLKQEESHESIAGGR